MQVIRIVALLALVFIGNPAYSEDDYSIPDIIELLIALNTERIAIETKWHRTRCLDPVESIRYANILRDIEALEELLEILKGETVSLWQPTDDLDYRQPPVAEGHLASIIKKIRGISKRL